MVWFAGFRSLYNEILCFEVSKKGQNFAESAKMGGIETQLSRDRVIETVQTIPFLI